MGLCTSRSVGYRGSEVAVNVYDRLYKPDGTRRGVIFAHGYNVLADVYFTLPTFLKAFTDGGLAGVVPDLGGLSTWGNDDSQTAVTDARTWLGSSVGAKIDQVLLVGGSMGCFTVLNWAIAHPALVAAIVCTLPSCDLQNAHDSAGFSAQIDTAYTNHAGYLAALQTHSPVLNAAALAGIPTMLVYSTNDPLVPASTVLALANAIGYSAELVSLGAVGHDGTSANYAAQAAFLARYA